jgi:HSP20 family protein
MFNLVPRRTSEKGNGGALGSRADHPLRQMRDEFDALFNRFFTQLPSSFEADWNWDLGFDDEGQSYLVRAEAPGFEAEDFDIQVAGNRLTIKAERKQESAEKKEAFYAERKFQRTMTLPAGVNADAVEARYHSGVLEVRLPKTPEAQAKRISVKT